MKIRLILFVALTVFTCGCAVYNSLFGINTNSSINKESFNWKCDTTDTVIFYYEKGSTAEKNIDEIERTTLNDIRKLLTMMGVENYNDCITYFLVESRQRMNELIGHEINAGAIPRQNSVYAVYGEVKAIGMHEFNHVIAHNILGNPSEKWLSEGFAIYSDDKWDSYDLHSLSKYFFEKGKIISLSELTKNFDSYDERITYPQSGSLVKYIIGKYGFDKFKKLWNDGNDGIETIYGKSISSLENEWIEEIKKSVPGKIDYKI